MGLFIDGIASILTKIFAGRIDNLIDPKGRQDVIKASNDYKKSVENLRNHLESPAVKKELADAGLKPEDFGIYNKAKDDRTYQTEVKNIEHQLTNKRRNKMGAKVYITEREGRADYKVYFVERDREQKNHQLITDGQLVASESRANIKVAIVKRPREANILITRKNFPK